MDPRKNLDVAQVLRAPDPSVVAEASYRGACSRAYYAAFGHAREVLDRAGIATDRSGPMGTHAVVAAALKSSGLAEIRSLGLKLEKLARTRTQSDYDVGKRAANLRSPIDGIDAQHLYEGAEEVINRIEKVRSSDKRLGIPPPPPPPPPPTVLSPKPAAPPGPIK